MDKQERYLVLVKPNGDSYYRCNPCTIEYVSEDGSCPNCGKPLDAQPLGEGTVLLGSAATPES